MSAVLTLEKTEAKKKKQSDDGRSSLACSYRGVVTKGKTFVKEKVCGSSNKKKRKSEGRERPSREGGSGR